MSLFVICERCVSFSLDLSYVRTILFSLDTLMIVYVRYQYVYEVNIYRNVL